jgi:hypothetical protein
MEVKMDDETIAKGLQVDAALWLRQALAALELDTREDAAKVRALIDDPEIEVFVVYRAKPEPRYLALEIADPDAGRFEVTRRLLTKPKETRQ